MGKGQRLGEETEGGKDRELERKTGEKSKEDRKLEGRCAGEAEQS